MPEPKPDRETTLVGRNLVRKFGDFTAVDGIDFEVHRGEIFGFLGPNGSGKTTTIRMMLGLLPPSSGFMEVLGIPVGERPELIRPRVGYMAQQFSMYRDLTAEQNLRFHGTAYGLTNQELRARIDQTLDLTGLRGRRHVKTEELSGGWRQRLALGAAIMHHPQVLFLDEPTAGVDPISRRAFWELLYEQAASGITVFVTTHYMEEAEHCHRLAFIRRGRIIATGSPDELRDRFEDGEVLELAPSDAAEAVRILRRARAREKLELKEIEMYGSLVHLIGPSVRRKKRSIMRELRKAGVNPGRAEIIEPSLEDVFIARMRSAEHD
ncbi:MAG: ABC transporter ATP-binding protein [Anaerolineae bacterium]|nr:MAG: ABC transporter ATP-binding protein [Anaerolineae bacterium]